MSQYILSPSARWDLKEINNYLAQRNPQAARNIKEKIKQQCQRLADFPGMGRNRQQLEPGLRSFPVEDYLIFYRQIEGGIEVARVVSGYRDLEALFADDDEN